MNKNCITMVAIQEETSKYNHKEYFEISKLCWQSYCKKHKINFFCIISPLPLISKNFFLIIIDDKIKIKKVETIYLVPTLMI